MKKSKIQRKSKRVWLVTICTMLILVGTLIGCNSEAKIEETLLSAEQFLEEQNPEQAQAAYEELIKLDAQCAEGYIGLAKIHIMNGSYDLAKEVLEQGLAAQMSLDGLVLPEVGENELDKVYIAVLVMVAGETTSAQQAVECYRQIDVVTADYKYTAEQLNVLAKAVLEQEDGLLDVLGFCNEKMLANPELEMDAEIASDMLMAAITGKITYSEDDYYLVDEWLIANMKHEDAIIKFLEKKMNFKYPAPANPDYNAQADELIAQYGGDYLIRHFFLYDTGEIEGINHEDGDYGIYNDKGMIIFDSATDIQDWSQDGLLDVSFFYDNQDRLIRIESSYEDILQGTIPVCREFVYNEAGLLTKVVESGNTYISINYDNQGRVIEEKQSDWYHSTYRYDDINGVMYCNVRELIWDGSVAEDEFETYLGDYNTPVKYEVYTHLSQGSSAGVRPVNEYILSDGTIMYYSNGGTSADFYMPDKGGCLEYTEPCFDLNETFYSMNGFNTDYEIHVEQVAEPAEDCINSHLAGKKYWTEDEYGIMEVVYDEYGLCDYTRSEYNDGNKVITYFVIYIKKYNEDGSIYSCPVRIVTGEHYSYMDSQYYNAFSGYCYQEYYR
ncbi:MAG: tetratricopeptide repeat protein [Lachnospiraceae bacterium]|nr:tetratricopeptide repeat protein [Lachnospiraceae bacterium]